MPDNTTPTGPNDPPDPTAFEPELDMWQGAFMMPGEALQSRWAAIVQRNYAGEGDDVVLEAEPPTPVQSPRSRWAAIVKRIDAGEGDGLVWEAEPPIPPHAFRLVGRIDGEAGDHDGR